MKPFTFIDLFAGIGGIRKGFESIGGNCVFTSEWDTYAQQTYSANFPNDTHPITGDITKVDPQDIPAHDVLLAGFPCQPFSMAGHREGFMDVRGTLFFEIIKIAAHHKPKVLFLENVRGLVQHDKGRTFNAIRNSLAQVGYHVHYRLIPAYPWVPQKRERIYIVAFREENTFDFANLEFPDYGTWPRLSSVLEENADPKHTLKDGTWNCLKKHKDKHSAAGNGFGYKLFGPDDIVGTISARYYKDGSEALIKQEDKNPRKLTPMEVSKVMGYPDFKQVCSDGQTYKQLGNSVVTPVIKALARIISPYI